MHIIQIAVEIAPGVVLAGVVAHGVVLIAIVGIIGMMPIQQRIIQADLEALGAEGVHKLAHGVPAEGGVGGFEIGIPAIEQAEAVMVLGGEDGVFHAGLARHGRPGAGIEIRRRKLPKIGQVIGLGHTLGGAHPLPARGDGIQPPMDKHAEPRLAVPRRALLMSCAVEHADHSFRFNVLAIMTKFNIFVTYIA